MPPWLIAAIALIRSGGVRLLGGLGGRRGVVTGATALALPDPFNIFGGGDDVERVRRRRRRRALTQSDRNDIAFIAATIGKAAAGSFAVQLATRSR